MIQTKDKDGRLCLLMTCCLVISGQTHGFQDVHNAIFVST